MEPSHGKLLENVENKELSGSGATGTFWVTWGHARSYCDQDHSLRTQWSLADLVPVNNVHFFGPFGPFFVC